MRHQSFTEYLLYYSRDDSLFYSSFNNDYLAYGYGEEILLTNFPDEITGLYLKPHTDSLFVLTANELLQFNITDETTTKLLSLPVSNEAEPNEIPTQITLQQNYPNPFNPSTNIHYILKNNGPVLLEVYDALGRKVQTLVDGYREAGSHFAVFDAKELASGIYFYRLEADGEVHTKRMTLIK